MKNLEAIIKKIKEKQKMLNKRYNVSLIAIFGSYARREENEKSDIDLIVEFGKPIGLKFFELADYLEKLIGVRVEIFTLNALKQKPALWKAIKEDIIRV
ncbi:MAG: nucleotidyltransferase family protein [Promethearchaeota archaeon]